MNRQTAEREEISCLPAPILQHILSFLSHEEAVQTCVLSKSWRYLGSSLPKLILRDLDFKGGQEELRNVLDKSLQVYSDQKLSIEEFRVCVSMADPELVSLLGKWIPIVVHDLGVKKFHLSFGLDIPTNFVMPSAVFESDTLQELYLESCSLSQVNSLGNNNHLKTLHLQDVCIEEETFAKIMSSCSLIEDLSLKKHNLTSFDLDNYFPRLTSLCLTYVPLSNEWFNSLSRNFPCLEDLRLISCNGFDEFQLSSRSIKNLYITMEKSTMKATIDAPSIKEFHYVANSSQSISFTTTSSEWDSQIALWLDLDATLWFPKISELVAAFSQSQINSLVIFHSGSGNQHIEHLSDISICCNNSYTPVAMKSLGLNLNGLYYDSCFSDLMNGLFRIIRPSEINQNWYVNAQHDYQRKRNEAVEFLCRTLQMGRWEDEGMSFWQHDLEEVSLEVFDSDVEEWHPVQGTIIWSEYVAASLPPLKCMSFYQLHFRLKWRDLANSFDLS